MICYSEQAGPKMLLANSEVGTLKGLLDKMKGS